MNIIISNTSSVPIYEQIEQQIKNMIASGTLQEGEMLPSMRFLAKELRISLITTKRAYEELEKEGLVYSKPGKGFYVSKSKTEMLKEKRIQTLEVQMLELIRQCKSAELSKEDVMGMLDVLFDEQ
jgi:GntR family transcriptional regulator